MTLGTASSLSDLRIFGNQFSGPLPPEFGKNCPIGFLDMSDNRLSGPIPATLCASGKLKQLMLLDNEFEGAIPLELGQCRTLVTREGAAAEQQVIWPSATKILGIAQCRLDGDS
jgi:hypothetical protein